MMGSGGPIAQQQPRGAGEYMGPQGGMTAQQRAMAVQQGARPPYLQVRIETSVMREVCEKCKNIVRSHELVGCFLLFLLVDLSILMIILPVLGIEEPR
jgi:hypothetical protein